MYKTDKKLMEMEGERKKDNAYKAYVLDRFTVEDVHEGPKGLCATIHDKETDEPKHYHKGDNLADGKIQMVDSDGIVFKPPKAKQPPFALRSKQELMPIKGDKARMKREELDEELMMHEDAHAPVMTISIVREAESY
tara:strand:- start:6974 stop:7384 length:411 start_codon:yes stop_codon:yes gene_type:complete